MLDNIYSRMACPDGTPYVFRWLDKYFVQMVPSLPRFPSSVRSSSARRPTVGRVRAPRLAVVHADTLLDFISTIYPGLQRRPMHV